MRHNPLLPLAALAALVAVLPLSSTARAAATYHWNVAGSGSWISSASWTPARTSPAADDILIFDNGTANTATSVIGQTIGQLHVMSGTIVDLRAFSVGHTITIAGGAGVDLEVQSGAFLSISTANTLALNVGASATGSLAGQVTLGGGAHRIRSAAVDGLVVAYGGDVRAVTGFSGNLFGTGTDGLSVPNSVRFQLGATYTHEAGANPFAATAPSSVVQFDHGSLYIFRATGSPSLSGRTYGDLTIDVTGTASATGSQSCTMDSLVVQQGTLSLGLTAAVHIKGSVRVMNALLQLGPGGGGSTILDGPAAQFIDDLSPVAPIGTVGIVQNPGHSLVIDNPAGVTCSRILKLPSNLHFLQGVLHMTGGQTFVNLDSTGTITNASQTTGWVHPRVSIVLTPATLPAREFAVGTETSYAPLSIHFGSITGTISPRVVVQPESDEHFYAQLDMNKKLNLIHAMVLPVNDSLDFDGMAVTVKYQNANLDPGADPAALVMRVLSYAFHTGSTPWRTTTPFGQPWPPSQVMALVPRYQSGDILYNFLCGEPAELTLATSAASIPEGGSVPWTRATGATGAQVGNVASFDVRLSQPGLETVTVDYETIDGTATVADNDYLPTSGTLVFAPGDTMKTVQVTLVGDGTPERHESFGLLLSGAGNATIPDPDCFTQILDDDDLIAPAVQVLSPNGGELAVVGVGKELTWQASDNVAVNHVALWLSRNGGSTWSKIATSVPNTGSYTWTVTAPTTATARLRVVASDDPGNSAQDESDADWTISAGSDVDLGSPTVFAMALPTPTPTRSEARLSYALPRASRVRLTVHDLAGRVVATLVDGDRPAGRHEARWMASRHAAGVYLVRIVAGEFSASRRIVVTR